jgi:hypothetical protein
MNTRGDRTIVTYCDKRIAATTPTDANAAVAVAEVLHRGRLDMADQPMSLPATF